MITIGGHRVVGTELIFHEKDAKKFYREHVVVSIKDMKRIKALAKEKGFLKDLQKLDIGVFTMIGERD